MQMKRMIAAAPMLSKDMMPKFRFDVYIEARSTRFSICGSVCTKRKLPWLS